MKVQLFLEAGLPPDRVADLGRRAADAGIETLWASSFPARREPFLCLSALAALRLPLQLGAVPLSPYEQHPLKIADALLTLNELSGGNATATIGGMGHSVMRVIGAQPERRHLAGHRVRSAKNRPASLQPSNDLWLRSRGNRCRTD